MAFAETDPMQITDAGRLVDLKGPKGPITVHAAGRGNPWVNLRDGVDLSTTYTGAAGLKQLMEQDLVLSLALTSADEAPDFLGAGDFDADGHWDVVAAARGSNALYWLSDDGQGRFGHAKQIKLPGAVTALVAGEINRADGLTDLVVGITESNGPQVLVFEGLGTSSSQ